MRTFVIASNNLKKVRELNRILIPLGIMAKTPKEMNITLDDVEETGTTFIENASLKARAAYELTGLPCIADDSGLMVGTLWNRISEPKSYQISSMNYRLVPRWKPYWMKVLM